MEKPKLFKPVIDKKLNNNRNSYYSLFDNLDINHIKKKKVNNIEPIDKLNELFNRNNYIFNIPVLIKTNEKTYNTKIAGKMGNSIITTSSESILIKDIISIEER